MNFKVISNEKLTFGLLALNTYIEVIEKLGLKGKRATQIGSALTTRLRYNAIYTAVYRFHVHGPFGRVLRVLFECRH